MGNSPLERPGMKELILILTLSICAHASSPMPVDVLIVVGAPGEQSYRDVFAQSVQDWLTACRSASKAFTVIEPAPDETNQIHRLREAISRQGNSEQELWMILIGHGTFDGKDAKFNLAGPDLSAKELADIVAPVQRPLVLINSASASAPFINALSSTNRIIVTATKSGHEENYARFGTYIAKAIVNPVADLDKDGQVSVLEAFLMASRNVEDFYTSEKRLATEHALIEDNGDGKGTPASFYNGIRPARKSQEAANLDGFRAHQLHFLPNEEEARLSPAVRRRRNDLELQLERARNRKQQLKEVEYLDLIEPIITELSRLYRDAAKSTGAPESASPNPKSHEPQ
jgi:hypothetical protein